MIILIIVMILAGFAFVLSTIYMRKGLKYKIDEAERLLERNRENAKHIEHTQAVLTLREAEVRKREEQFYNGAYLKNMTKIQLKYAVSESDYLKYSTPYKIRKRCQEVMSKQLLESSELNKCISEVNNSKGDKLYTLTVYVKPPTDNQ